MLPRKEQNAANTLQLRCHAAQASNKIMSRVCIQMLCAQNTNKLTPHIYVNIFLPFQCFTSPSPRGFLCISLGTSIVLILRSISCMCDWILTWFSHRLKTDLDTPSKAKCMYSGDTLLTTSKYCKQLNQDGPFDPKTYTTACSWYNVPF